MNCEENEKNLGLLTDLCLSEDRRRRAVAQSYLATSPPNLVYPLFCKRWKLGGFSFSCQILSAEQ